MNKISKEKQQQLVLVILVTVLALAGVWFGLISSQKQNLRKVAERKVEARKKLQLVKQAVESADEINSQLSDARKRLDKAEEGMASGDLYSWAITTIRTFKLGYKIDIQIGRAHV